jgi:hypothetical protein
VIVLAFQPRQLVDALDRRQRAVTIEEDQAE